MKRGDRETLRTLLHPYMHWTSTDGAQVRGRVNVLSMLAGSAVPAEPASYELRDGQIYRWDAADSSSNSGGNRD